MGAGHLVFLTWLGLDLSVSLLGLETQSESNSSQGDMKNVIKTRLYPACHNGDIQAINDGSSLCS